jgi:pimeloyl-ACP methyl ester carboxylesterase
MLSRGDEVGALCVFGSRPTFTMTFILWGTSMPANHEIHFVTDDGIRLNGTLTRQVRPPGEQASRCMIVVPGFAQHSQTNVMSQVCETLSQFSDVLCLDPRGTGKSEGGYYFGAKEHLDIKPALQWTESRYADTYLLGLSLGAYSALRAAICFEHRIRHLFLISCPTSVDEIFWTGAGLKHASHQILTGRAWAKERNLLFKWRYPFLNKPSATGLAAQMTTPVSFLIGGRDRLTPTKMSHRVYRNIRAAEKRCLEIQDGGHADELLLPRSDVVQDWLLAGLSGTQS